jgi:cytochrome c oxidase subunit 2
MPPALAPRARKTALLLALGAVVALALALAPGASADFFSPESGGSPNANEIDSLYWITFVLATIVFLGVEGALLYSVIKFRARKGAVAAQIRGNTRLEIGWTVGAAVILVVLAVVTFVKLGPITKPPNSDPTGFRAADGGLLYATTERQLPPNGKSLNIQVNGQQYIWRYTYPDSDNNVLNNVFQYTDMIVPTDTTITLDIRSQDVAHSWWIPKLGGKQDAIPGYVNHTWFKISKPGIYLGNCAELCGRNHANMDARVIAIPPAKFAAWLVSKKAQLRQADLAAAKSRKKLEAGSPNP